MKIAVIGYSGAGKSTLAKQLGALYHIPVLHLDQINFLPNWQERNREEAEQLVSDFMEQEHWIIDGNYKGFCQERRLKEADRILFLNFPRFYCLLQAWKRYRSNRGKTRSDMADGCLEKFDFEFFRWILWAGRTKRIRLHYKYLRQAYPEKFVVFKRRKQVIAYLEKLQTAAGASNKSRPA